MKIKHTADRLSYLLFGVCASYSIYILISQRFPFHFILTKIAFFTGLSIIATVVIYFLRTILTPSRWQYWNWQQKIIRIFAALLLTFLFIGRGVIHYNDPVDVTLTIFSQQQSELKTFYCTGLFSRYKERIISPQIISSKADSFAGVILVNNGNGIWGRMPDMGSSIQIKWEGQIQKRFFPISIGLSSSKNSGTVTIKFNDRKQTVDLHSDKEAISYIQLPPANSSTPSLHFFSVWVLLTLFIFRPLLALSYALKKTLSHSYKYLVECNYLLFIIVVIALPVIIFNLQHVFGPHYLLHDDPVFYRHGINHMVYWPFWDEYYSLKAFTEGFSWWIMAHYSPYVVRLLYLLIYMTGISLSIYWIARRIFNLCPICSYVGAVLPAIYPIQYEMVAGINLSYTLISTLIVLLSLITGFHYLVREHHSWSLGILSGFFFAISASLTEHPVFLTAALGFVYLTCSTRWKRKIFLLVPMFLTSCAVLYRMVVNPRGAAVPIELPWDVILSRGKTFFVLISPFSEGFEAAFTFDIILLFGGILSLFFYPPLRDRMIHLAHFSWLPERTRLLVLPTFIFLWTIPSAFPFIALKQHMPIRTLHIAGYGPWLLMAPGLVFVLSATLYFLNESIKNKVIFSVFVFIVSTAGIQHLVYAKNSYKNGNAYWASLSKNISFHAFPEGSEIVITNASTGTHQTYYQTSGYLSRLLGNRTDITGLVGYEFFYYDPFANMSLSLRNMTGLTKMDNLHLYRWVPANNSKDIQQGGSLQEYSYFLRVVTDESVKRDNETVGDWYLYSINSNKKSELIHNGHGLEEYLRLLRQLETKNISPQQICWGNPISKLGCNSPERIR